MNIPEKEQVEMGRAMARGFFDEMGFHGMRHHGFFVIMHDPNYTVRFDLIHINGHRTGRTDYMDIRCV